MEQRTPNRKPAGKPGKPSGLVASLLRILKGVRKEFKLVRTDVPNLLLALVVPPLIIILFSSLMTFSSASPVVRVTVVSYDSNTFFDTNSSVITTNDDYTVPLVGAINGTPGIELVAYINASEDPYAMDEAYNQLARGSIDAILVIPVEFSEFLDQGLPGMLESVPNTQDLLKLQTILNKIQEAADLFARDNNLTPFYVDEVHQEHTIPARFNVDFNNNMNIILPFVMVGITLVLTILVVVQEKPVPRLLLTPTNKAEILVSKYVAYTVILLVQSTAVLVASIASGLFIRGQAIDLWGALMAIGFSGVSIGMFISSLAKTKTEANQLFFAFFIILFLVSGIFVPIDGMPAPIRAIAYAFPLAHGAPLIDSITTKGLPLASTELLSLVLISVAFVALSFVAIARRKAEV
ncbi:MAG: ABC transporter permease [Candidatus Lokiarchaeota archaeon]|nr:ABC transporter permease [Candidatus Lokiarchaeota archaeon]